MARLKLGKFFNRKKKDKNQKPIHTHKGKVALHRFPKNRSVTDPLWFIPISTWCFVTLALCIVCIQFADFTWLYNFTQIKDGCSDMHKHLVRYLLNYHSYLIAVAGALGER